MPLIDFDKTLLRLIGEALLLKASRESRLTRRRTAYIWTSLFSSADDDARRRVATGSLSLDLLRQCFADRSGSEKLTQWC